MASVLDNKADALFSSKLDSRRELITLEEQSMLKLVFNILPQKDRAQKIMQNRAARCIQRSVGTLLAQSLLEALVPSTSGPSCFVYSV